MILCHISASISQTEQHLFSSSAMNRGLTLLFYVMALLSTFGMHAQNVKFITHYELSGYKATPRYDATLDYFQRLDKASRIISTSSFGTSPQGRDLIYVVADKEGLSDPQRIKERGRLLVLVQACIHPGESEGKDAGMLLLRDMAINKMHLSLLDSLSIVFMPIFNVDGHERFGPYHRINQNGPEEMGWRTNAINLNLNRDYLKADTQEMLDWLSFWNTWQFDFLIDIHTTNGADYQYPVTYQMEVHGNMDPGLGTWCRSNFLPAFESGMKAGGFPVFRYVTFRRWTDPLSGLADGAAAPRLSHGYAAICNRPGLLIETHMLKDYKTRVEGSYASLVQSFEIISREKPGLASLILEADQRASRLAENATPCPLRFRTGDVARKVWFDGYAFESVTSPLTGSNYYRYTDSASRFELDYYDQVEVTRSAVLPYYYILPVQYQDIRIRLDAHGIRYLVMEYADSFDVVMTRFRNPVFAKTPYEGRFSVEAEADTFSTRWGFPAGSLIIPTNQPKAPVIAHIFEPGAPDSYLFWGFFHSIFEQKEYAEEYVMDPMAQKMLEADSLLRAEFEEQMKNPDFANNRFAVMNWFYQRTPYWDQQKNLYPVGRCYHSDIRNKK
jgi:hypothetical protein